jgi:hypothetical protein
LAEPIVVGQLRLGHLLVSRRGSHSVLAVDALAPGERGQRPRIVSWIAGLYALEGLILLPLGPVFLLTTVGDLRASVLTERTDVVVYAALVTAYGALALPIAFGLFQLRAWA